MDNVYFFMETNTSIVPIAIEQYDKRFVINFGHVICPKDFGDIGELTQNLRDALAILKWKIWETMPRGLRAEYGQYEIEKKRFFESFLEQWKDKKTGKNIYTEELVNRRTYKET